MCGLLRTFSIVHCTHVHFNLIKIPEPTLPNCWISLAYLNNSFISILSNYSYPLWSYHMLLLWRRNMVFKTYLVYFLLLEAWENIIVFVSLSWLPMDPRNEHILNEKAVHLLKTKIMYHAEIIYFSVSSHYTMNATFCAILMTNYFTEYLVYEKSESGIYITLVFLILQKMSLIFPVCLSIL